MNTYGYYTKIQLYEEEIMSAVLLFTYKELKILIKLLVNLFCLSVSLQMLSSGEDNLNSKQVLYKKHAWKRKPFMEKLYKISEEVQEYYPIYIDADSG